MMTDMKTAIITGANSGIGQAIARLLNQHQWKTILIARNKRRLEEVASSLQNPCDIHACDLSDPQAVIQLGEKISNEPVSALINNAGIYQPSCVDDDNEEVWEQHFQTNLMSAVRLTRLVWPILKQQKQSSIVNITSTLAIRPIANTTAYSALKAAMNNWTLSLAIEGATYGIRANAICPGIVDTPIHSFHENPDPEMKKHKEMLKTAQPLGRIGKPQDIAPCVYHLCEEQSGWTTGTLINIDGGILLNS